MDDLKKAAHTVLSLMDLTSLNDHDNPQSIIELCQKVYNPLGTVAAVCVFPRFVPLAKQWLAEHQLSCVKVATVTNFPGGQDELNSVLQETHTALAAGADEIDVVLPYQAFQRGDYTYCQRLITACKKACGSQNSLKVILESGELMQNELIHAASLLAIESGADFIKTSTGKAPINATLEAANTMLNAIKESGSDCGFKAAGGIRTPTEAIAYLTLAEEIMGSAWINRNHLRFGASSLLQALQSMLSGSTAFVSAHAHSTKG